MGLFSFVTDAGGKLGSAVYDMLHDDEGITKPVTISPERINELRQRSIQVAVTDMGVDANTLNVVVDGETVTLTGSVPDQATSEKVTLCAGNQHGISSVDCQLHVDKPEPESQIYTVKSGDTLGKIAKEFYGNAAKYMVIFEANQPLLKDPNRINIGQALRIPPLT